MRSRLRLLVLAFALVAGALGCSRHEPAAKGLAVGRAAPGFDGATAWLNVDHPLTLEELRGKVVVVDFWTSCCINCLHTLPRLAALEKAYAGRPVVVVGVHSAKFDMEQDQERLRQIVSEYDVRHPVAIDGSMKLWESWGAQAWPTLVVLDPTGHISWTTSGEPPAGALEKAVATALAAGEAQKSLSETPVAGLRREVDTSGPLSFPGKVIALADGSVAIADTGHHRVVFAGADGAVQAVVGSGLVGLTDGSFAEASFRKPRGLAEAGDVVYVADTENHAVRAIDRRARTVTTVAGTGELGASPLGGPSPARTTKLRSPWDLLATGGVVYVALAGSHQIAALRPAAGTIEAFAGDGEERRLDGAGPASSFAQPSGLATDGKSLFVADAESSSVREVALATRDVHTMVGQDLFVFGDVDGPAPRVRLEHPVGIGWSPGALWVADTYNSKIKRFDLATGVMRTVVGGRDHAALFEPEGVVASATDDRLLVADTKHHRVVSVSKTTGALAPFELHGLTAPSVGIALEVAKPAPPSEAIDLGDVPIGGTGSSKVHFDWKTPVGTGINEEAPFKVTWTSSDGLASVPTPIKSTGATVQHGFDLTVTPVAGASGGRLAGDLALVLCDTSTHLVCVPIHRAIEVTFRVATAKEKAEAATVMIPLPEAKP